MALSHALIVVALVAAIFSTMAVAKDFVVGDESGWTTWFDYQAWASNKVFRVGDTLTFKYTGGKDNVVRVNGSDFMSCSVPSKAPVLTSGHDTIVLTTTGRRWYISGVGNHCKTGQKLFITVLPPQEASWSPEPSISISLSPSSSPSPMPAPEVPPPSAPWTANVPHSISISLSPSSSPSPMPTPEVPPPNAPWTANVPHFRRSLTKFFQRNLIAV